jgi:hypothetical protein
VRGINGPRDDFQNTRIHYGTTSPVIINPQGQPQPDVGLAGIRLVQNQPNYIKRPYKETLESSPTNAHVIYDYIIAEEAETNIQESTKSDKIKKLCILSRFFHHQKSFTEMTKSDILSYLNSLRKSPEIDPTHRSIGNL